MKKLDPAARLIVAADFEPSPETGVVGVRDRVLRLADDLAETGVVIKVESILRAAGYQLITDLHNRGLKVFADLKLNGIPQTLSHDGMLLAPYKPELVTAMANTGRTSLQALKAALPDVETLAVTFLTTLDADDAKRMFGCDTEEEAVLLFGNEADSGGFDGLISAPGELKALRGSFGERFTYNTPNIRPDATEIVGDDQNRKRAMTPRGAIKSGAARLVVGRPITQAKDRKGAARSIIDEIAAAA